jgi:eukaryotic-like serine/threonine-protein kinase
MPSNIAHIARLRTLVTKIVDDVAVEASEFEDSGDLELEGLRRIGRVAAGFRRAQSSASGVHAGPQFTFGPLQVFEKIGAGSHGDVYRARDPLIQRDYALKLRGASSGLLARQFLEEATKLASVRHAHIVTVYGAAIEDERIGLWTELVHGASLADLHDSGFRFAADDVRAIGSALCGALAAAHRQGIVHGDVKAANVMRDDTGRIVLMDFGAALYFRDHDPSISSGTLRYLAPEVLLGARQSPQSDIYALGVLMHFLLSGTFPHDAEDIESLIASHDRSSAAHTRIGNAPKGLRRAIGKALESNPAKRHRDVLAFQAALAPQEGPRSTRAVWAAAGLAAIALITVIAIFMHVPAAPPWQARAELYRETAGERVKLESGSKLSVGDKIDLEFESNRPSSVYVFDADERDKATVLFPIANMDITNPLPVGRVVMLPGRIGQQKIVWSVNSDAAGEEIVVVAVSGSVELIDKTIAPWPRAAGITESRGVTALALAPVDPSIRNTDLKHLLERISADTDRESRVWRVFLPHQTK